MAVSVAQIAFPGLVFGVLQAEMSRVQPNYFSLKLRRFPLRSPQRRCWKS